MTLQKTKEENRFVAVFPVEKFHVATHGRYIHIRRRRRYVVVCIKEEKEERDIQRHVPMSPGEITFGKWSFFYSLVLSLVS